MEKLMYKIWDVKTARWLIPSLVIIHNHEIYDDYREFEDGNTNNDAKIILSTGEKDVTGKLVFEGDILQPSNRAKELYPVVYKDAAFQREYTFTRSYEGETWEVTDYFPLHARQYRVVGNIYDNPEMMKRGGTNGD